MSDQQGDLKSKSVVVNYKDRSDTKEYCLQDVRLRIDAVGNDGRGEAEDYLLSKLKMEGAISHVTGATHRPRLPPDPLQLATRIFFFGIF